ncbi:hypothetical protein PIB30_068509, partial [Stylosanthes scabra]|nr:hypothetical protein [Stylosanthes scabra]
SHRRLHRHEQPRVSSATNLAHTSSRGLFFKRTTVSSCCSASAFAATSCSASAAAALMTDLAQYSLPEASCLPFTAAHLGILYSPSPFLVVNWMPIKDYVAQPFVRENELFDLLTKIWLSKVDEKYTGFSTTLAKTSKSKKSYLYFNKKDAGFLLPPKSINGQS